MADTKRDTEKAEVHTELRDHDADRARAADQKRQLASGLPKTMPDDDLDDLFNDMPV